MNLLEEKAKERQFAEDAKRRLIRDSFLKNDTSGEHIEHLVKLLEDYEPADKQAMEEGKQKFEEFVKKNYAKEARKSRLKKVGKCLSAVAMVALIIILSANVVTQATMHKNIFDFVLGRNSMDILDYEVTAENVNMTFDAVEAAEQYLGEKVILPENTLYMKTDEIYVNETFSNEYDLYIRYTGDDKYLTFNIKSLKDSNGYMDDRRLSDPWVEVQLDGLRLSNTQIVMNGDNYRIYTYINKSAYEIASDLAVEDLVEILNSIPLPSDI